MRLKNSRWTMVMVGVIALLMVGTMVWASPPAGAPSAPVQAYDAKNADKVDGLHASKRPKANTLLALNKKKKFPASVIPAYTKGQSDARFLNDDRQEIIKAAVTGGAVLTVGNTGTGSDVTGLYANGEDIGVHGYSSSGHGVYGKSSSAYGVYGSSSSNFGVYGYSESSYGVYYDGGLAGTGSKSAIVETEDYAWRHLYAMESPEVWFEDFGTAQLVDGQAVVGIEPIFAQTVNLSETYHVFLTPLGDCGLFVADKSPTSFTIQALGGQTCNIAFDYRIIAKRLGYEDERLEPAEDPNELIQEMD